MALLGRSWAPPGRSRAALGALLGPLGARLGPLFGGLGRHSGPRGLLGRPGDRFGVDFGSIWDRFGVAFPLDFSTESVFELAVDMVRDRLGGSLDLCAIGSLSATLRDSLHQPISSIYIYMAARQN